jgi:hypothetical protein
MASVGLGFWVDIRHNIKDLPRNATEKLPLGWVVLVMQPSHYPWK